MSKTNLLNQLTQMFNNSASASTLDFSVLRHKLEIRGMSRKKIHKHLGIYSGSILIKRTPTKGVPSSNFNLQEAKCRNTTPKPLVKGKPTRELLLSLYNEAEIELDLELDTPPTEEEILARRFN